MQACKSLLVCFALLGVTGCESTGTDTEFCGSAKCDDPSQLGAEQLMPRAPSAPGTISMTRRGQDWLFEVIGSKGEIVLLSEPYSSRSAALNGVLSAEENGVLGARYQVSESGGNWSYLLRAANGQILADSQAFSSEEEANQGAASARDLLAGIIQYKAAMTSGAAFDLGRAGSDWRFELRDEDGAVVMQSQDYSRRTAALTGIASVRNNGKDPLRYQVLGSPPRFILKAGNGEEIAESASSYASEDAARAAIDSIQALLESERVANPW